jgi:dienelactone hydrolase
MICPSASVGQEREQIITYKYKTSTGKSADVEAVLRLPEGSRSMRAAVILHDGGGWSAGRTKQYADLLTRDGFVTLEPRIYRSPGGWDGYNDLSKVFGALKELAKRADVNPASIYVMGQSAGAMLTILAASDWANKELNDSGTKFRAHASLYPVCWIFAESAKGNPPRTFRDFPKDSFQTWSGAPVKLFIGTRDDYDDRDSSTCSSFVDLVANEAQRRVFSIVKYENATHGWDHGSTYSFHTPSGCKGKGCTNTNESSPEVTRQGYQDLLEFFGTN